MLYFTVMQKRVFTKERVVSMPSSPDAHVTFNKTKKKKIVVDDKYKYKKNWLVLTWQFILYYFIAKPLFLIYGRIFLGIKVYGKENLKNIKGGAITVSNHVHYLDFSIATNFIGGIRKRTHVVAKKDNFDVPFAGKLMSGYGCMPLPETPKANINFYKQVTAYLKQGRYIHLFPEASMWPYYNKLRPHKTGAYHFASKNNVPVVPYVIVFRESKGFAKLIRRRPRMSVYICKPLYTNLTLTSKQQNLDLQTRTIKEMEEVIKCHPSYEFFKYIPENEFDINTKNTRN